MQFISVGELAGVPTVILIKSPAEKVLFAVKVTCPTVDEALNILVTFVELTRNCTLRVPVGTEH